MHKILITAFAASLSLPVMAQEAPKRQDIALAAGYKAMFTCSAVFNGGKTSEQITGDELSNYYGDYVEAMALTGEVRVNTAKKYVSVKFADDMPPRISAWREHLGCTALPQGADKDFIKRLPRVKLKAAKIDPADVTWPMGDKLPNAALPDTIDKTKLETAVDKAFEGGFDGATTAVVITQNGRLVTERYRDGFDMHTSQRTWSVAKSIGASMIGAAQHKGLIEVKDKAGLEAWSRPGDPRGDITVENLLQMASGLNSDPAGNRTDNIYFGGGLMVQNATKNPLEAPPGARWRYANNDTMLAMRALREEMSNDKRYQAFPFKALLHKIGMYHTVPEMDWGGDFILSSQVWTTARDLARLGQLSSISMTAFGLKKKKVNAFSLRVGPIMSPHLQQLSRPIGLARNQANPDVDMAHNFGAMKTIPAYQMIPMPHWVIAGNSSSSSPAETLSLSGAVMITEEIILTDPHSRQTF